MSVLMLTSLVVLSRYIHICRELISPENFSEFSPGPDKFQNTNSISSLISIINSTQRANSATLPSRSVNYTN